MASTHQGTRLRSELTLVYFLIEPFFLIVAEPEKGFALPILPDFEIPVLPSFEMLSSLAHFLKPTFRE
jgi:hypothetical protein